MSPFFIKGIQLFLSLSLLIILHELGHFIPAKIFKIRVEKFYLFFDVKFSLFKKKIGETVYGIGWLPLGGYVKIAGMIDESMDKEQMAKPEQPWEFRSKPAWQRLIIMVGGVTVNIVLGVFIYIAIVFTWGSSYVSVDDIPNGFLVHESFHEYGFKDGDRVIKVNGENLDNMLEINKMLLLRDIKTVTTLHQDGSTEVISIPENIGSMMFQNGVNFAFSPYTEAKLDSIIKGMPAEKSGLLKGDKIISLNNQSVATWNDFQKIKAEAATPQTAVTIEYLRNGQKNQVTIEPNDDGFIGISPKAPYKVQLKEYSFVESISEGISSGYWTLRDYVAQFKYVFTKKGASQLGGFGAIGNLFPNTWNWKAFWATTAFISIILAFMNILPIPALDGGHVMFLLYEMISGRKPNEKFMEYSQYVGFAILLSLVVFANGNDIYRAIFEK